MATATAVTTNTDWRQRWFLVGLVFFFAAINAHYFFKIQNSARPDRSAIQRWLPQLEELSQGENIWLRHNFPYPPIMAILLEPLAHMPHMAAAMVWFLLKAAMTVVAIYLLIAMLDEPTRPFPAWGKILAVLLSLRPIQGDLVHGNVNLFILVIVVAALFAFTRGRDWWAGLLLALAIACKVTPALFVPYFIWKRAWKTVAATAVGLGLFFFAVPSIFVTWEKNQAYLGSWYANMVKPFLTKGEVFYSEHNNQSLPGLANRMLTHSPSFSDYDENDQFRPLEYHNIADLNPRLVGWLVKGCLVLFAVLVMLTCRTPIMVAANEAGCMDGTRTSHSDARRDWRLIAEFAVILLGMLLFSERTWKHHCVTLLVPFAVLAYVLSSHWKELPWRWYVVTALALSMLLMSATSTGLFDSQDRAGKLAQVYGAYVWTYFILLATLALLLVSPRRRLPAHHSQWNSREFL